MGHFYLINHLSSDDYLAVLDPWIERGVVTLFSADPAAETVQRENYNFFALPFVARHGWVATIDLDEYMYARAPYATVSEYLSQLPSCVGAVQMPFKNFGSNGYDLQPASLVESFTRRELFPQVGSERYFQGPNPKLSTDTGPVQR